MTHWNMFRLNLYIMSSYRILELGYDIFSTPGTMVISAWRASLNKVVSFCPYLRQRLYDHDCSLNAVVYFSSHQMQ
jgi:hypothetical protein